MGEEETGERNQISDGNKSKILRDMSSWCNEMETLICPSCGHIIQLQDQAEFEDLAALPAGVKFHPSDQEIVEHLETKVVYDHSHKLHPLIDQFIPTLEGENGICYTHPEKLPGVNKDGQIQHFFHRPSKAYTTGTRKRRKVHTEAADGETRWHKTGKTRPILIDGTIKGYKKILVLYRNCGRQKKPEKTNWVMHQYHLGDNGEEKDGELVVSKVFHQTQPRQCGSIVKAAIKELSPNEKLPMSLSRVDHNPYEKLPMSLSRVDHNPMIKNPSYIDQFCNPNIIPYNSGSQNREIPPWPLPNLAVQGDR